MILVALTLVAAVRPRALAQKTDWTKVIVTVTLFLLGVRHQRHVVFFVLAASPLCTSRSPDCWIPCAAARPVGARKSATLRAVAGWGFGTFSPRSFSVHHPHSEAFPPRECRLPAVSRGLARIHQAERLSGNLATAFDWGSYAGWKLYPQCKVMFDGRYEEVFPNEVFDVAMRFSVRKGHWREALTRFHTDMIVLPKAVYKPTDLALLPDWKPVYEDFVSLVLLPRDKVAGFYVRPDFRNAAYSTEDLAKPVDLAPS